MWRTVRPGVRFSHLLVRPYFLLHFLRDLRLVRHHGQRWQSQDHRLDVLCTSNANNLGPIPPLSHDVGCLQLGMLGTLQGDL